ncbi:MAG: aminotransferase class I/II-fold pyridoxal phosphate-dependent enzyme, partial [Candidatus Altarchaeaceae archaeon]
MRKKFEERRNYIVKRAREIFDCYNPEGAFYIFPKISNYSNDSRKFSEFLLENAKVAVVPGIEFGKNEYIRISYATSMENIKDGFDRIEEALKNKR